MPNTPHQDASSNEFKPSKSVRELLRKYCPDDSELMKFALDNFPDTHMRITSGMDRVAKENIILQHHQTNDIIKAIKQDYPNSEGYIKKQWHDEAQQPGYLKSRCRWFSQDLGRGLIYRTGPLVLTYLSPGAKLSVNVGPPWEPIEDIVELRGSQFRGQFFVEADWSISANSQSCLCSGYYPIEGLPLADGDHNLSNGAIFYKKFGKQSLIMVPIDGELDLSVRKQVALKEVRMLLQRDIDEPEWTSINVGSKPQKYFYGYLTIL